MNEDQRLLPRYRTNPQPARRRLDDHLHQIEARDIEAAAIVTRQPPPDAVDRIRLRGIPCIAEGVGGTSPGTAPHIAILRSVHRRRYG